VGSEPHVGRGPRSAQYVVICGADARALHDVGEVVSVFDLFQIANAAAAS
jgi:hypothetical protein